MRMFRQLSSLILMLALAPLLAPAAAPPDPHPELTRQVRELEKKIAEVRGLDFRTPVDFRVIARGEKDDPGVQGYYDTKKKALFLYNDIKGNYQKGVLIHEMVHALQDQHFGLRDLHAKTFGSEAELAMAALIEGDATYTMIEILEKEQPFVTKMLNTSLDKSKNLRNAFLYGVGGKYVQELKKQGGWRAVNARYMFAPPKYTASILHPEERIIPTKLGPGKSVGEFGIISMFHNNATTQPDCMKAASGWRGDRVIEEQHGTAWVVVFATPEQASLFRKTLVSLRSAEYPKLKATSQGEATTWKGEKTKRTIEQRGTRVVEVTAPEESSLTTMTERGFGPPVYEVYSAAEKKTLTFGEFTDRLMSAQVICVGEHHDDSLHHAAQLAVIKALYARDESLGVGMEMFQRNYQKGLDRYFAGAIDEATMLEDTDYKKRWGWDWTLYKPIVDFCKRNQVPLAGLNVSNELRDRIRKLDGIDKLTDVEKKELGEIDFNVKKHRDHWTKEFNSMEGHGPMSPQEVGRLVRAMTIWDDYMADSAVKFLKDRKLRRLVVLAGSGHIDWKFGIPERAARRGTRVVSVHIHAGGDLEKVKKEPPADFVLVVR